MTSFDEARTWTQNSSAGFSVGRGFWVGAAVAVGGARVGTTAVGGLGRAVGVAAGRVGVSSGAGTVGSRITSVMTNGVGVGSPAGANDSPLTDQAAP